MTVVVDNETMLKMVFDVNLITWLWAKIGFSTNFKHKFSKFVKLVEITYV
jgi:hypothetical protein